jgi:hypothetical protein
LFVLVLVRVIVIVIDLSCSVSHYGSITMTSTAPHGGTEHEHDPPNITTKIHSLIKYHQIVPIWRQNKFTASNLMTMHVYYIRMVFGQGEIFWRRPSI